MTKTKRSHLRGAAHVELLVIAGIVVTAGAAAVQFLGNGASEKSEQQATCMQSFSCADGASPGAGLAIPGAGSSSGGGRGGGTPAPVAASVAPPASSGGGIGGFFRDVVRGATLGDYAEGSSWGQVIGQVGVGLIPFVGQAADARDFSAAARDVWQGRDGGWLNLAVATVAFVPLAGDGVKAAVRGGREALSEGTQAAVRTGSEAVTATRAASNAETLVVGAVRRTAQEALPVLRQTTQGVFDAGPNRWVPTGNAADGTLIQRGLTGDYGGGRGGIYEAQRILEGTYDQRQTVSLVGEQQNVSRVTSEVTSIYNDPLAIQARVPPSALGEGRTSAEALTTRPIAANEITGMGAFIPTSSADHRLTWARQYLSAQERLGITPTAGSRGAQFNSDLREAIASSAKYAENEYGRFISNSDEVAQAVDAVLRRYETP